MGIKSMETAKSGGCREMSLASGEPGNSRLLEPTMGHCKVSLYNRQIVPKLGSYERGPNVA